MSAKSAMSLSITTTFSNCVSASAPIRLNECLWKVDDQRGGATSGPSITAAAPRLMSSASAVALRSPPATTYTGRLRLEARAVSRKCATRLNSRRYARHGAAEYLLRTCFMLNVR